MQELALLAAAVIGSTSAVSLGAVVLINYRDDV